jgi:hypothetical protein
MDLYRVDAPPSGHARGSGGCFHLSFRSGSRCGGASAAAAADYLCREEKYDNSDRDPAIYTESGHLPSWAHDDPHAFWDAVDLYERANGRLFVSADFALPRDLDAEDRIALAHEFAASLTAAENLPYTLAIHAGRDGRGQEHNPHAHLMLSERRNDGIERTTQGWFRRANADHPERGGASKSRTFHGREWVEKARERWAELTNQMFEARGRSERVDHRSYERRGIDREPGTHYGPGTAHMAVRGEDHERLDDAVSIASLENAVREIDREIVRLEAARASVLRDGVPEDRVPAPRDYSHSSGSHRGGDRSWGR